MRRARRVWTDADKQLAAALLDDGASFREVGRTIGRPASVICRRFPGRGWTVEQVAERAALDRRFQGAL